MRDQILDHDVDDVDDVKKKGGKGGWNLISQKSQMILSSFMTTEKYKYNDITTSSFFAMTSNIEEGKNSTQSHKTRQSHLLHHTRISFSTFYFDTSNVR